MVLQKLKNEVEVLNRTALGDVCPFAELFYGYCNRIGEFGEAPAQDLSITGTPFRKATTATGSGHGLNTTR